MFPQSICHFNPIVNVNFTTSKPFTTRKLYLTTLFAINFEHVYIYNLFVDFWTNFGHFLRIGFGDFFRGHGGQWRTG